MSDQSIIRIEHRQDLTLSSDAPQWSESVQVVVSFFSDALTSGWLGQFCGRHANDLIVLLAIGFHGAPLRGPLLERLIASGAARAEDEGRLCCLASDKALADELRTTRETIGDSTSRLEARQMVTIADLRPLDPATGRRHPLQSESGAYLPSKVYLVSGNISKMIAKSIHRVGKSDTVETGKNAADGVGKSDTADAQTESGNPPQIKTLKGGGGEAADPLFANLDFTDQEVWAHFLAKFGKPHDFSAKEVKALANLRAAGYSLGEIQSGIDRAFARPAKPQNFSLCAAMVKDQPPQSAASARTKPESRQPEAASDEPTARQGLPPARSAAAGTQPETGQAALAIPPELEGAVKILREAGETLTGAKLARLVRMAEAYQSAAAKHGATAIAWIERAMTQGLGEAKSSLIGYADTILRRWARTGPDEEPVPPAQSKARTKKTTASDRIARTREALNTYRRPDGH
jgi:hypothetical protein